MTAYALRGWIDLEHLAGEQRPQEPPEEPPAFDPDFKVAFGQRLMANFHVELEDHRVITAIREDDLLPQDPRIGGALDGYFDFNLERGRAAQTFP